MLGLEISRLAQSSADLMKLLELYGLFGTLVIDEDGIYDTGGRTIMEPDEEVQHALFTLFWAIRTSGSALPPIRQIWNVAVRRVRGLPSPHM